MNNPDVLKTGYLCDPNTTASNHFFLPFKRKKIGAIFWDANLACVAPKCRDAGGACLSVLWHFWPKRVLSKVKKGNA
jgi:hypothetical protein